MFCIDLLSKQQLILIRRRKYDQQITIVEIFKKSLKDLVIIVKIS